MEDNINASEALENLSFINRVNNSSKSGNCLGKSSNADSRVRNHLENIRSQQNFLPTQCVNQNPESGHSYTIDHTQPIRKQTSLPQKSSDMTYPNVLSKNYQAIDEDSDRRYNTCIFDVATSHSKIGQNNLKMTGMVSPEGIDCLPPTPKPLISENHNQSQVQVKMETNLKNYEKNFQDLTVSSPTTLLPVSRVSSNININEGTSLISGNTCISAPIPRRKIPSNSTAGTRLDLSQNDVSSNINVQNVNHNLNLSSNNSVADGPGQRFTNHPAHTIQTIPKRSPTVNTVNNVNYCPQSTVSTNAHSNSNILNHNNTERQNVNATIISNRPGAYIPQQQNFPIISDREIRDDGLGGSCTVSPLITGGIYENGQYGHGMGIRPLRPVGPNKQIFPRTSCQNQPSPSIFMTAPSAQAANYVPAQQPLFHNGLNSVNVNQMGIGAGSSQIDISGTLDGNIGSDVNLDQL